MQIFSKSMEMDSGKPKIQKKPGFEYLLCKEENVVSSDAIRRNTDVVEGGCKYLRISDYEKLKESEVKESLRGD